MPAQGHLGGPRRSRLRQKQAYLCHSSALEVDPTLALATEQLLKEKFKNIHSMLLYSALGEIKQ